MTFRASMNAGVGKTQGNLNHERGGPNNSSSRILAGGGGNTHPNHHHYHTTMDSDSEAPLDPFLMDFGASVSVHEDQIRHVRGGTQEIEERISKTHSDLKKEEMLNRQLKQDLVHCETEKRHILQVTSDQLETVQMQRNVLQGLENTLCANLVVLTTPLPASVVVVSPDRVAETNRSSQHTPVNYGKDVLPNRHRTLTQLSRQMKDDTREIKELHLQMKTYGDKLQTLQERVERENLPVVLSEKTKEADRIEKEVEQEMEKSQVTKAAILKKRTEAGSNAQELADLTQQCDALRREHQDKKKELLQEVKKSQEIERQTRTKREDLKTMIANAQAQIRTLQAAERLQQELVDTTSALDKEQKREVELTSIKNELSLKLEASKIDLEVAQLEFVQATKLNDEARNAKMVNDEEYNVLVVPGRVELSEIAEKKEILAREIKEIQKSFGELETTEKEHLNSKLEDKRLLLFDLSTLQEQADHIKSKHDAQQRSNQQSKENWEREIKELDDLEANLRNTTAAKEAHMKQLMEAQAKRRRECLDEALALSETENAKNRRLLKLLGSGEKYIAKAKDKVKQLGEDLDI